MSLLAGGHFRPQPSQADRLLFGLWTWLGSHWGRGERRHTKVAEAGRLHHLKLRPGHLFDLRWRMGLKGRNPKVLVDAFFLGKLLLEPVDAEPGLDNFHVEIEIAQDYCA